jgi:hypothetical protein
MSFLRYGEIFPFDGGEDDQFNAPAHRLDESPAGYSLAGCSPAVGYQTDLVWKIRKGTMVYAEDA